MQEIILENVGGQTFRQCRSEKGTEYAGVIIIAAGLPGLIRNPTARLHILQSFPVLTNFQLLANKNCN